jgi:hypothetical protein
MTVQSHLRTLKAPENPNGYHFTTKVCLPCSCAIRKNLIALSDTDDMGFGDQRKYTHYFELKPGSDTFNSWRYPGQNRRFVATS